MAYISEESFFGMRVWAGWNIVFYLILLICGFLIFADERIQKAIVRQRFASLFLGIVLLAAFRLGLTFAPSSLRLGWYQYVLSAWCLITAILGFGMKHLTESNRFLEIGSEAVLPFYILHQPVILLIGFGIVQLSIPVFVKYVIIAILSFTVIVSLYAGIRRVGVLRFLFGMKSR